MTVEEDGSGKAKQDISFLDLKRCGKMYSASGLVPVAGCAAVFLAVEFCSNFCLKNDTPPSSRCIPPPSPLFSICLILAFT